MFTKPIAVEKKLSFKLFKFIVEIYTALESITVSGFCAFFAILTTSGNGGSNSIADRR